MRTRQRQLRQRARHLGLHSRPSPIVVWTPAQTWVSGCGVFVAWHPTPAATCENARRVGGQLGAFEALGAAASCLGNVGPAFGSAGPFGSYAGFTDLSKVMLSLLMLLGRVEIVPVAVLFTRSFWRR